MASTDKYEKSLLKGIIVTALSDTPTNLNFLNPLNFRFAIQRSPSIEFFIQKVTIPSLTQATIVHPNPMYPINFPGRIKYGDFTIEFKVDEALNNYMTLYNWMTNLGFPESFDQYANIVSQPIQSGNGITSDLTLLMLNALQLPTFEFAMRDAYPVSLSEVIFDTTNPDVQYVTATATFKYITLDVTSYTYAANTGVP